jgi:RNA-directed DNA polymerase
VEASCHQPLAEQHHTPSQKLHGHFAYYGITGNGSALQRCRDGVVGIWKKWLARRRRRGFLFREVLGRLLKRYVLPPARVLHSVYRQVGEPVT